MAPADDPRATRLGGALLILGGALKSGLLWSLSGSLSGAVLWLLAWVLLLLGGWMALSGLREALARRDRTWFVRVSGTLQAVGGALVLLLGGAIWFFFVDAAYRVSAVCYLFGGVCAMWTAGMCLARPRRPSTDFFMLLSFFLVLHAVAMGVGRPVEVVILLCGTVAVWAFSGRKPGALMVTVGGILLVACQIIPQGMPDRLWWVAAGLGSSGLTLLGFGIAALCAGYLLGRLKSLPPGTKGTLLVLRWALLLALVLCRHLIWKASPALRGLWDGLGAEHWLLSAIGPLLSPTFAVLEKALGRESGVALLMEMALYHGVVILFIISGLVMCVRGVGGAFVDMSAALCGRGGRTHEPDVRGTAEQ